MPVKKCEFYVHKISFVDIDSEEIPDELIEAGKVAGQAPQRAADLVKEYLEVEFELDAIDGADELVDIDQEPKLIDLSVRVHKGDGLLPVLDVSATFDIEFIDDIDNAGLQSWMDDNESFYYAGVINLADDIEIASDEGGGFQIIE